MLLFPSIPPKASRAPSVPPEALARRAFMAGEVMTWRSMRSRELPIERSDSKTSSHSWGFPQAVAEVLTYSFPRIMSQDRADPAGSRWKLDVRIAGCGAQRMFEKVEPGHCHTEQMRSLSVPANPYRGYRFPEEIISQCVWLYFNFCVSLRDVELMMAFRGEPSYETVRRWCNKFGKSYADKLRQKRPKPGESGISMKCLTSTECNTY